MPTVVSAEGESVPYHLVRLNAAAPGPRRSSLSRQLGWPAAAVPGAVIGNFDGMHLGHLSLASLLNIRLAEIASTTNGTAVPIFTSFAPHPRRVIANISRSEARSLSASGDPRFREITPIRSKCLIAAQNHFDYALFFHFGQTIRNLSAERFVSDVLGKALGLKLVVVGYDWAFGRGRTGTVDVLQKLGQQNGIEVLIAPKFEIPVAEGPLRVSSSLVRSALASGDLGRFTVLTGRPFSVSGRVSHGDHRGSQIGFPTANLHLPMQLLPPDGVYAAWSKTAAGISYPSVLNIGRRPTFNGSDRRVEVHLLDYPGNSLYHQRLELQFVASIRSEQRFESIDALKSQIQQDIQSGRRLLSAAPGRRC